MPCVIELSRNGHDGAVSVTLSVSGSGASIDETRLKLLLNGLAFFGSRIRSNVNLASSAASGCPSDHFRFGRRGKVSVGPSADKSHFSANEPVGVPSLASGWTSASKISRETRGDSVLRAGLSSAGSAKSARTTCDGAPVLAAGCPATLAGADVGLPAPGAGVHATNSSITTQHSERVGRETARPTA